LEHGQKNNFDFLNICNCQKCKNKGSPDDDDLFFFSVSNDDFIIFQKEKVKVYIDEKYHHAMDPSIRPNKNKMPKVASTLGAGNENNLDGIDGPPTGNSLPPSEKHSRASTLVRDISEESKPGNDYGKDIKDIPGYKFNKYL